MQAETKSPFQQSLVNPGQFTITLELVPSRGGHNREHDRTLELAEKLARDPRIQAVSITENAGGHAALSPEILGREIQRMGLDVIVHFSSKDKNRNQMESLLFAWDRLGIRDLLVITGDYPQAGYQGFAKPVFDLGSVHVLDLISRMNQGNYGPGRDGITPTSFLMGVALSPFKRLEAELLMQYAKLHRKAAHGADYIITQVGYDARKFHELIQYVRQNEFNLPVLGNVFVPNLTVAALMHTGKIPGCIITDALYAEIRREADSPDKGKQARLLRGAKLLAILKGLGYAGAHLGGPGLTYDNIDFLLTTADSLAGNWQELAKEMGYWHRDGFYLYTKDEKTGLNTSEPSPPHEGQAGLAGQLPDGPVRPQPGLHPGGPALPAVQKSLPGPGRHQAGQRAHPPGACDQVSPLRLPELRGLHPGRPGLCLPAIRLRQIPAERPLRRQPRRLVRGVPRQEALPLCAHLRTPCRLRPA